MIKEFETITRGITALVNQWEPKLLELPEEIIAERRNNQNRTIKQITGHMVDSASNNTHRIIHLQYQESPFRYPNYAIDGNNDRWIAIQNYQEENWSDLVRLWKFSNLHIIQVIKNIQPEKLENEWVASPGKNISLREMVNDYLKHLELHLSEINELISK